MRFEWEICKVSARFAKISELSVGELTAINEGFRVSLSTSRSESRMSMTPRLVTSAIARTTIRRAFLTSLEGRSL